MILQYLKQHKTSLITLTFIFTFSFSMIQNVSASDDTRTNITNSLLHITVDLPEENGIMRQVGGGKIWIMSPIDNSMRQFFMILAWQFGRKEP
jgi:hypothetical protein